ncbi:fused MFS/spermidine synthase [Patescibacteria group bacterium]
MRIKNHILEITVFFCGAVVMMFEIVGSRVIAPYLGSSIFVWTSLIGVILGGLAVGYWIGGKIADKNPTKDILSFVVVVASFCLLTTIMIQEPFMMIFYQEPFFGIRLSAVIASLVLFFPTSVLLGMVAPYAVKLKVSSIQTSGSTVGSLYAISTVGSIVGTFLAGFFLIPTLGTTNILVLLSATLAIVSIALQPKFITNMKVFVLIFLVIYLVVTSFFYNFINSKSVIDVDTEYSRVWIFDHNDARTGREMRSMVINNENSSGMFLDSDELASIYAKYYDLAKHFNPEFKSSLLLGGAGYSYPKYFLSKYPDATMDVVEIDSGLTELAEKYFGLKRNPRLTIYHEDGRTYLNRTQKKYDIIYGDAYKSFHSLPYQLTTREAVQRQYDILNDNGVVLVNIISTLAGGGSKFLRAEYATFAEVFPQVYLFKVGNEQDIKVQNVSLIALKSKDIANLESSNPEFESLLNSIIERELVFDMPVLTDDHAPVDYYINEML